jgi:hypothetical protein
MVLMQEALGIIGFHRLWCILLMIFISLLINRKAVNAVLPDQRNPFLGGHTSTFRFVDTRTVQTFAASLARRYPSHFSKLTKRQGVLRFSHVGGSPVVVQITACLKHISQAMEKTMTILVPGPLSNTFVNETMLFRSVDVLLVCGVRYEKKFFREKWGRRASMSPAAEHGGL